MTSVPPLPENRWTSDQIQAPGPRQPLQVRPPFSEAAIVGFVLGCVGLVVPAFIGPLAAAISRIGLKHIRQRGLRGRGLAIAGIILGVADLAFYLFTRYALHS